MEHIPFRSFRALLITRKRLRGVFFFPKILPWIWVGFAYASAEWYLVGSEPRITIT